MAEPHTQTTKPMAPVLRLVSRRPQPPSREIIEVLEGILTLARGGELDGIVFGLALNGRRYFCDAAGSLHNEPVGALGVCAMLMEELHQRMPRQEPDTQ